jgi:diguanylate cyclase (GGDEF)-like protein
MSHAARGILKRTRGVRGVVGGAEAIARRAPRPVIRVWMVVVSIYAATALLYVPLVRPHLVAGTHESLFPWILIAIGFAVTELKGVDVHFRRERHSFSLSEVPAVIGLFALTPLDYLLALMIGTGAALLVDARQSRVRRSFNLGNVLLGGIITLWLFHALVGSHLTAGTPEPFDWVSTAIATISGGLVNTVMVALVISVSGGAPQIQRIGGMIQFAVMVTLANTSIALLAVVVLTTRPFALVLLPIPIVVIFFAYRAYVSERVKHERLELLYESSRILQHTPQLDAAVYALVEHARKMFRSEVCQLVIFPDRAAGQTLSTTSFVEGPEERMAPLRLDVEPPLWRQVRDEQRAFFWNPGLGDAIGDYPLRQVMVSPLTGEFGPMGMMLVANRLAEGDDFDSDDLRLLETVANQVGISLENGQLERSLTELSRLKEELRFQAYHDTLTGLPNRAMFTDRVEERLANRSAGGEPVVMFLDLDDFKIVNDTLGHGVGDRLLVAVADRIKNCLRETDVAARLGGDEFAIILAEEEGMVGALAVADRLVGAMRTPFQIVGHEITVGASVGVAAGRSDIRRADDLLRNADVAMYTAKANGKRRVAVFDPLLHAELRARHELSSELARSLGRGELQVHYQPVIELASRRITGVEALVRWRHPVRGFVPPEEFVRLAEENGSIEALGVFVLEEACRQTAAWRARMDAGTQFAVNVNVSPKQLQQPGFSSGVQEVLERTGLRAEHLVLEMTETGMFQDTAMTITKLRGLQDLGVRIAMDDFGTGYSSLSYLRRFPIDILKIARDFVSDDGGEDAVEDGWAFAEAIVALGQSLRMTIVAEGIETPAQLERLVALHCQYGQGFLFSRPKAPEEIEQELIVAGLMAGYEASPRPALALSPA